MDDAGVKEILAAKASIGKSAYLQVSLGSYCILWDKDPLAGSRAKIVARWTLDQRQVDMLIKLDAVDSRRQHVPNGE